MYVGGSETRDGFSRRQKKRSHPLLQLQAKSFPSLGDFGFARKFNHADSTHAIPTESRFVMQVSFLIIMAKKVPKSVKQTQLNDFIHKVSFHLGCGFVPIHRSLDPPQTMKPEKRVCRRRNTVDIG